MRFKKVRDMCVRRATTMLCGFNAHNGGVDSKKEIYINQQNMNHFLREQYNRIQGE